MWWQRMCIPERQYISAEQALADFSASLKEYSGLLNGYNASNNPMQASFNVKIADPMRIKEVKAYAETLGVDDYIRKPFPMDRLLESVKRLIGE